MKPEEFAVVLRNCAEVLPDPYAVHLQMLARVIGSSRAATIAATVKRLEKANLAPAGGSPPVSDLLHAVGPLRSFVEQFGKPAVAKDMEALFAFLQGFSGAGMSHLIPDAEAALREATVTSKKAVKEDAVERHRTELERTLGDDEPFKAAFHKLEHDAEVGSLEIAALAKRFAGSSSKSREAALKKIWARHHALMVFKAKSDSRGGRSAA